MAFFNFRRSGSNPAAAGPAAQPESVEAIRKRAKHRLIGAVVLVLLGVVGFPLLFDTQPRPIAVDIPIEIPGKNSVKPLTLPAPAVAVAPVAVAPPSPAPAEKIAAASSLSPKEEILPSKPVQAPDSGAQTAPKTEAKAAPRVEAKAEPAAKPPAKTESKPASKPPVSEDDGARARALLNGTDQPPKPAKPAPAEGSGRVIVQVGAFADAAKASEARAKLEKAGLKTYTQVADTKDGKRTRVRVGPFASRAEAEQAVDKIKTLGLPAAVLTL